MSWVAYLTQVALARFYSTLLDTAQTSITEVWCTLNLQVTLKSLPLLALTQLQMVSLLALLTPALLVCSLVALTLTHKVKPFSHNTTRPVR
jgi:Na+/glutamate symporter